MRNRFIQGSWDGVYILYCQVAIDWCYFLSVAVGLNGIDPAIQIQEKASFLIMCVLTLIDW